MLNTLCGSVINLSGFKNIGGVVSKFYTYHPLIKITQCYLLDS